MNTKRQITRSFERALKAYGNQSPVEAMTDFVADAMHLCRLKQFDFDDIVANAKFHFDAESEDLPALFDDYEVHGVAELGMGKDRYCEQAPDSLASFWGLYGHFPDGDVDCIGEFATRELAEEAYARITGRRYGQPLPKVKRHA